MDNSYWRNKVAVVTGASVGIGASTAVLLANAGMTVVGLARRVQLIEVLNDQVKGEGKILAHECDLNDEQQLTSAFAWLREKFQCIHVLVCNAGILKANFLSESTTKDIKELFDTNVVATACCLREGLKLMAAANVRGHIVVMNSVLGHRIPEVPVPLFSVYPATKHAITALCQTVRQEIHFLKLNIKLTSICPGMVDTDFLSVYSHAVAELPKLQPLDVAKAVLYALDTPDGVQVEDIILQQMRKVN
ncbi:farnesol dehydrogenase [Drosophila guanche]|uniref:Blast:Dehydrogenase/reductase SDR family member 11 n=1 Tax=Drosophila guanche TaxID=7266 RepID=A0A3B0K6T0_DROGU|nr:farnesol dehydrogenase [Drosophila guanche]SPP81336.1 blast:Dehydrogenase/reductase SDR family member 11 [Drosophila guanche]